jgi:hypothetical protein
MGRAAGDAGRQAARLGLLIGLAACAVIEQPPGGPPDFAPPFVASVRPDSGAVVPEFDEAVRIQFDEVISEQSGGGLDKLVAFSPRSERLKVSWKRDAIEVEPDEGWREGVVYHVVLLPGIQDLRQNRMEEGTTIVFTTGAEIPDSRISGTVLNWEEGRVGQNALVEAILLPDSLVYTTRADSSAEFELTHVPRGEYLLVATIDGNNNRVRDAREAFDSVSVTLDSLASQVFWTFVKDTTGPQLRDVAQADSSTIRLDFNQKLALDAPQQAAVSVWELPDTMLVPIDTVWDAATYDSVRTVEQAARDSAAADSAAAVADTAQAAEPAEIAPPRPAEPPPEAGVAREEQAEPSRAAVLLEERPALSSTWYIRMPTPLGPGRYLIGVTAANLSDAIAESQRLLIVEAPADST